MPSTAMRVEIASLTSPTLLIQLAQASLAVTSRISSTGALYKRCAENLVLDRRIPATSASAGQPYVRKKKKYTKIATEQLNGNFDNPARV